MIIWYSVVFLFWLLAVVMVFKNVSRDYNWYDERLAFRSRVKVWMCMIIATTFLMVYLNADFLKAWVLKEW